MDEVKKSEMVNGYWVGSIVPKAFIYCNQEGGIYWLAMYFHLFSRKIAKRKEKKLLG